MTKPSTKENPPNTSVHLFKYREEAVGDLIAALTNVHEKCKELAGTYDGSYSFINRVRRSLVERIAIKCGAYPPPVEIRDA